jgi:hypothetical protein
MDNEKFSLLISVLSELEDEDIIHSKLKDAIVKIIGRFYYKLTKEQKEELSKEFTNYERVKLERAFERLEKEII